MPEEERLMFAMSVVTLTPLFLVFLFGQQFLVKASPPPETDSVRDLAYPGLAPTSRKVLL
jgi:hypothetical protein